MALYYEYNKHEFSFNPDGSSDKLIPLEWNVKFGDIIALGGYRDTGTIIVGLDNLVVHNPDYSNYGHLSIPLDITKQLFDAWRYYKKIFLNKNLMAVSIDLKPDDQWIISKFGKAFNDDWKIRLWYSSGKFNDMDISFNINVTQSFKLDVTYDKLMECYKKRAELRYSFNVWYNIFNDKNIKKFYDFKKNIKMNLPITWIKKNNGGDDTENHISSQHTFYGPQSDSQKSYQAVKSYYAKFIGIIYIHITEPIEGIRNICGNRVDKNGYGHPIFNPRIIKW